MVIRVTFPYRGWRREIFLIKEEKEVEVFFNKKDVLAYHNVRVTPETIAEKLETDPAIIKALLKYFAEKEELEEDEALELIASKYKDKEIKVEETTIENLFAEYIKEILRDEEI